MQKIQHYNPFFILAALYIGLHICACMGYDEFLWGVDQWRYCSGGTRILLFIFGIGGTLFIFFKKDDIHIPRVMDGIYRKHWGRNKYLLFILGCAMCTIVFSVLRQKTFFLGDGYLLGRTIENGIVLRFREFLDTLVHSSLYILVNQLYPLSGFSLYAAFSILCGVVFVYTAFATARLLSDKGIEVIIIFILLTCTGMTQFFFGYVEVYSTVALLITLYSYYAIRYITHRSSIVPAALVFSISTITHISTVALFPSLAYLLWISSKWEGVKRLTYTIVLLLVCSVPLLIHTAGLVLGFVAMEETAASLLTGGHIMPFLHVHDPEHVAYPMISIANLIDITNEFLLLSPIFLFAGAAVLIYGRAIQRLIRPDIIFFMLITCFYGFELAVFNKAIGASRDWDIFAPLAVPITIAGILILRNISAVSFLKLGALIIPGLCVHTFPWILVNASEQKSLARFVNMAETNIWSPYARGYAYDELRSYYEDKKKSQLAMKFAQKSVEATPGNYRYRFNLATRYYVEENFNEAVREFTEVINLNPRFSDAYNSLGAILLSQKKIREAQIAFHRAIEIDSTRANFISNLGNVYVVEGNFEKAIELYQKAISMDSSIAGILYNMALTYFYKKDYKKSWECIERLQAGDYQIDPNSIKELKRLLSLDN